MLIVKLVKAFLGLVAVAITKLVTIDTTVTLVAFFVAITASSRPLLATIADATIAAAIVTIVSKAIAIKATIVVTVVEWDLQQHWVTRGSLGSGLFGHQGVEKLDGYCFIVVTSDMYLPISCCSRYSRLAVIKSYLILIASAAIVPRLIFTVKN